MNELLARRVGREELIVVFASCEQFHDSYPSTPVDTNLGQAMKQIVKLFRAAVRKSNPSRKNRSLTHRRLGSETLEKRQLLASDVLVAHNYLIAEDVNRDSRVTAIDALSVINQMSRHGGSQNLAGMSRGDFSKLYDVSGDNKITALDALRVINAMSRSGEGLGPNDEVIELVLTPRTVGDAEFGVDKFNAATRELTVAVGETFFLEVGFKDLRNSRDGDTGVFQIVADIVTGSGGTIEPVLTETQILQVDDGFLDAASGNLNFTRTGVAGTPFSIPATDFAGSAIPSLRTAITTLYGFTTQQFSVVPLGSRQITQTVNGVPVTRSVIEFQIRFTDLALANIDIADLAVAGDLRNASNATITVASTNFSTEPRLPGPNGGINPLAIVDNINYQSRTFDNDAFYGLPFGSYDPAIGVVAAGGVGPVELPASFFLDEPFDAFSIPFRAVTATPAAGVDVRVGVTAPSTNPNVDTDLLRYSLRLAAGRLAQPLDAQASSTTVFLDSVAGFRPLPGETSFLIQIGNNGEVMLVTAVNSALNTFTVVRGQNNSTITSHQVPPPAVPNGNQNFNIFSFEDEVIPSNRILVDLGTNPAIATDGLGFVRVITSTTANTVPTISNIADRTVNQGTSTGAITFTLGDAETAVGNLTVIGSSSNITIVPNANIVFGGSGANRTVTITPAAGQVGNATITVTVSDGTLTATDTFVLTVNNVTANTAPTISNIADRTVTTGVSTGAIAFTVADAETPVGNLTATASSSNITLVPTANIVLGGSGANRTVTVTPVAGQVGNATITVTVSDGTLTATDTFVLTVNNVTANTAPTISNIADRAVTTGVSTGAIAFTVADAETPVANLTVSASSSNITLVSTANIVLGGSGANRTVTITPAAGQVGSATITVTVNDGTLTATDTFLLTVNTAGANTAPTISNIADRAVTTGVSTGAIAFTVGDAETPVANLTVSASSSNTTLVSTANIVVGGSGANRTVTVTPAAGQVGNATITVTVSDGTLSTSDTFVLTVSTAANTAPTISNIADRAVTTGVSTGAIAFTVGDAETPVANLTVSASSSNTTLVPTANIVFSGSGASRTVTITPAAGQVGTATITVTVNDGTLTATDSFLLTVNTVGANTAPTISNIANRAVTTGVSTGAIAFTVGDAETPVANLTVSASSSNTTLVPTANIVVGGSGANRTVTVTPATGQVGNATITVTVSDGTLTATDTFVLTVSAAANTAPTISNIADRAVTTGVSTGAIAFTVGDAETPVANLTVSASSSNTTLVPTANIVVGGSGANRTVTVTPVAGQVGNATITVTVSDGALTASDTFFLTVNPAANTAPTISNIVDRSITIGTSTGAVAFIVGDTQTAVANLTVTGTSSNTTLVPTANIVFGGSFFNRTVTVTPVAGQTGTATITVTVSDGSLTASDTFVLTVTPPANTAPTISNIAAVTINEGAGTGTIAFTVGDSQTAVGSLVVSGTSSNATLVPNANIVFGGSGASRTVTVTPVANRSGAATITVTVSDGSLSTSDTFVLTVNSVNDAPTGASATRTVGNGAAYTFSAADFPITDVSDSPANTLAGIAINTLPNAAQGTLRLAGAAVTAGQFVTLAQLPTLTFNSVAGVLGNNLGSFTFQARDNGGTANGGVDTDPTSRTFDFNLINFVPSTISGKIFTDFLESLANPIRDGVQDPNEPAVGGLTVRLSRTGTSDVVRLTDSAGNYAFSNLSPGTYTVKFEIPDTIIEGSRIAGSTPTTTLSSSSFQVVIAVPGGLNATGNNFTVLGTKGSVADTLDILVSQNRRRSLDGNTSTAGSSSFAVLGSQGDQQFFQLGDGFEDARFVELAVNADRDAALLTVLNEDGSVESSLLSGNNISIRSDGKVVGLLGDRDDLTPVTDSAPALAAEFGDYRDAIDAILAGGTV